MTARAPVHRFLLLCAAVPMVAAAQAFWQEAPGAEPIGSPSTVVDDGSAATGRGAS